MRELNIDAIIASVKDAPADIDKEELLADLDAAYSLYQLGCNLRCPSVRRKEKDKTIELAQKLVWRLEKDFWYGSDALVAARKALKHIEARKESAKSWRVLGVEENSAFDNLVGIGLATIFQNHFKLPATYTKDNYDDDNPIKGSFIDFAKVALAELGMRIQDGRLPRRSPGVVKAAKKYPPKPRRNKRNLAGYFVVRDPGILLRVLAPLCVSVQRVQCRNHPKSSPRSFRRPRRLSSTGSRECRRRHSSLA
jgi:hypothetical protein